MLVDSRPGIVACVNETLVAFGHRPEPEVIVERIIGPPLEDGFRALLRQQAGDVGRAREAVAHYRKLYANAAVEGTRLQPGVREMLARLAGRLVLAVATSKPIEFSEPILSALGVRDHFTVVAGPSVHGEREGKTQTLARALALVSKRHGVVGDGCMIGDRCYDIVAAHATGLVPIGAAWGFGSEAELREAGATWIVARPGDLPAIILPPAI